MKTSLRNSLDLKTENNYLFVHFNLPSLYEWSPDSAVINWINKKDRRKHNLSIDNDAKKSKNQLYFKGVFPQESECSIDIDDMTNCDLNNIIDDENLFIYDENPCKRLRLN